MLGVVKPPSKIPSCVNGEEAKHLANAPTPCTLKLQSVMLKFLFDRDRRRLVEGSDCHGCAGRRRCKCDGRLEKKSTVLHDFSLMLRVICQRRTESLIQPTSISVVTQFLQTSLEHTRDARHIHSALSSKDASQQ